MKLPLIPPPRYGDKPSDSPFLWKFMTDYMVQTARYGRNIALSHYEKGGDSAITSVLMM